MVGYNILLNEMTERGDIKDPIKEILYSGLTIQGKREKRVLRAVAAGI